MDTLKTYFFIILSLFVPWLILYLVFGRIGEKKQLISTNASSSKSEELTDDGEPLEEQETRLEKAIGTGF